MYVDASFLRCDDQLGERDIKRKLPRLPAAEGKAVLLLHPLPQNRQREIRIEVRGRLFFLDCRTTNLKNHLHTQAFAVDKLASRQVVAFLFLTSQQTILYDHEDNQKEMERLIQWISNPTTNI